MRTFAAVACVLTCLLGQPAQAKTYQLSFTATHFTSALDLTAAPQDPVSGSITFQADALGQPITGVVAVSLSIAGHSYSLAEIAFESPDGWPFPPFYTLGGQPNGAGGVPFGVNDFYVTLSGASGYQSVGFAYSVPGATTSWIAYNYADRPASDIISSIVEVSAPVPEPSQALLLAAGLAWVGSRMRARRKM